MSYPILYDANATNFFNLGLGVLKDAVSCLVTEEINGRFQLDMIYPVAGIHAELIKYDNLIKADAGHARFSKDQLFRIERIEKSADGMINIIAKHVSYLAQGLALEPTVDIVNQSAHGALDIWRRNIVGSHPFTVESDISTLRSTTFSIADHQNARMALGGTEGSILDVWGGEYIFDNYRIDLRAERGGRANTLISYGRNLTDLTQEENISNTFTSIYPYAIYHDGDDEKIITIDGFIVDAENAGVFAHRRVLPVDFSREFDRNEQPTPARLKVLSEAYIKTNDIGKPRVSMALRFVDLTKSLNQAGLTYEQLNLCDIVPIRFERLGIDTSAKIVRVVWDVLLDQYDSLDLGEMRQGLSDKLRNIERDVIEVSNDTNSALTAANGRNTIFFGPDTPIANRVGDLWYRPNGDDTELWMWNGSGWEFVMSTAVDERLREEIAREMARVDTELGQLNNETLPGIQRELNELERELDGLSDLTGEWRYLNTVEIDGGAIRANTITTNHMRANTINGNRIATNTLNADRIVANTITGDHIRANSINGDRILANSITGNRIAANAITANHIATNAITANMITTGELNAANVRIINLDAARITSGSFASDRISSNAIIARHIHTNALEARHIRAGLIAADMITTGSMHGDRITAGTIGANRIATNAIEAGHIRSDAIVARHIHTDALEARHIRAGLVRADRITTHEMHGDRIQADTLNANRIIANSITANRIATDAIQARHITAGAVTANHIAAGTITADRLNVTNGFRIGNYFMDGTTISTFNNNDFIIRRNRNGSDNINRLVIGRNNIRFYSEASSEDGAGSGIGIRGHMLIEHNRLAANNNPDFGGRLINLHLQPANRNLGRITMQGVANTLPGEVRATYNTSATGEALHVYAPMRCAYLSITGQRTNDAGTIVHEVATGRHIGVNMANSRLRFASGVRPSERVSNIENSSRVTIEANHIHGSSFQQYSSKNWKENIISLQENDNGYGLDLIKSLEITEFDYIDECNNNIEPRVDAHNLGVILEETNPKIVNEEGDSVNLTTVLWSSVLAMQQLLQRIEKMENEIKILTS